MCGITGIFSLSNVRDATAAMTARLAHRGPDDCGLESLRAADGEPAGMFGHRRLAVIDLSAAGHQPMFSRDRSLCITYNGEIYNFAELRAELEQRGVRLATRCDTEVLLEGWATYGIDFLSRLRGMFALALWDSNRGHGYLIRDAFGIKPLYFSERDGQVIFASEVRAILSSGTFEPRLSVPAIATYLSCGSISEPLTIIEGVYAVPPGCVIPVVRDGNSFKVGEPARFRPVFEGSDDPHIAPQSHVHRIRNALRESVAYHLVSDVPVALFLSGGIDSSAIAGLASEVSPARLDSFTVTFAEADYSEAAPAREAARQFNTRHHEILLSGQDLLGALPDVFESMDQPSMDGLNTFVVSRSVRSYGIKVVLSGLGGDELFAGYPSFHRARAISPLWKLPSGVRRLAGLGIGSFNDHRAARVRLLLAEAHPARAAYTASRTLFDETQVSALLPVHDGGRPHAAATADMDVDTLSLLQQVSFFEITGYMRNTLLRDSDVFSMAHALELRVPFVDVRVAAVARAAADSLKIRRGRSKPLLVDAIGDLLPPGSFERPKRGFTLPFETWMRDDLFAEVNSVLSGRSPERAGLRPADVAGVWSAFQARRPGVNWSRPWALYTLVRWAERNGLSL